MAVPRHKVYQDAHRAAGLCTSCSRVRVPGRMRCALHLATQRARKRPPGTTHRCTRCTEFGHNARRCPRPLVIETAAAPRSPAVQLAPLGLSPAAYCQNDRCPVEALHLAHRLGWHGQ